jgi:septal ring-binding cell division protein DamX
VGQAPETPPEPPAAPPSPPAPPAPAAPAESRAAAATDLAWLARQKDDDWLLQVFASDRLPAARAAIARHGLGDRARVIPTTRDGAPWYVVVIGPYPDRARATAALAGLPQALRAQGPFPKRVSDLERSARRTP